MVDSLINQNDADSGASAGGDNDGGSTAGNDASSTDSGTQDQTQNAEGNTEGATSDANADGQSDKGKDDGGSEGSEDKGEESGAPESYEAFDVPEGMTIDDKRLEAFQEVGKELNLSQENAQKFVNMYAEGIKQAHEQFVEQQNTAWAETNEKWKEDTNKEFPGEKLKGVLAEGVKAIQTFGGNEEQIKEFKDLLDYSGVGNHPAFVRVFSAIGRAVSADNLDTGHSSGGQELSLAQRMFPNMPGDKPKA